MEHIFYINMFGGFSMSYSGKNIFFERNTTTKTNQLLQLLVCAGEQGVQRERIISKIFGKENITNPSNSLRITVFRLRKLLGEVLPEDDYIRIENGVYYWTSNIPTEVDALKFQELAQKAETVKGEKACELEQQALDLYKGEFLPQLGSEEWVVIQNIYYRNIYFKLLQDFTVNMKKQGRYDKLLAYVTTASNLYPFEDWQVEQMDCLIALNRLEEAVKLYEKTSEMFFEELGITPSERMMKKFQEMGAQVQNTSGFIEEIQKGLCGDDEEIGPYYCSYPSFAESYRYIRRVIRRTGQSAFLMLCTITDTKGVPMQKGEKQRAFIEELKLAVKSSLRSGDLYSQYSPNQILLLLMEIKQEDCEIVMKRVKSKFDSASRKNALKFCAASIADVEGKKGEIHFSSNEFIWR